jgi:hypothetical protein
MQRLRRDLRPRAQRIRSARRERALGDPRPGPKNSCSTLFQPPSASIVQVLDTRGTRPDGPRGPPRRRVGGRRRRRPSGPPPIEERDEALGRLAASVAVDRGVDQGDPVLHPQRRFEEPPTRTRGRTCGCGGSRSPT